MRLLTIYLTFFAICFTGCKVTKKVSEKIISKDDYISFAIQRFIKTKSFKRKDSVYNVRITEVGEDYIGVSIFPDHYTYHPEEFNTIGTSLPSFPTRCFEDKGRLFLWYDPDSTVSINLWNAMLRYDMIDSINLKGESGHQLIILDHSIYAHQYFFCKKNPKEYFKFKSKTAMEYFNPDMLDCKIDSDD